MNYGLRIKELREKSGFTQNRLAEWAGVSQSHLRRVELGQSDITIGLLEVICEALNITLKDFFNVDNEKEEITSVVSTLTPKQRQLLIEFIKSLNY